MSFKNAIKDLRRDWGLIKEHVGDDLNYVRQAKALMFEERAELREAINVLRQEMRDSLQYNREQVAAETRTLLYTVKSYIKLHGGAILRGLVSDLRDLAVGGARVIFTYAWRWPWALICAALTFLAACAAFLSDGRGGWDDYWDRFW